MKVGQDRICLGVQISKETHAALVKKANSKELTISDIVRIAIKDYLKNTA